MKVYYDGQWIVERDSGEKIALSWNESSLLYEKMREEVIWDEVDMRIEDDEDYEPYRDAIEAVRDSIVEDIMDSMDISSDVIYQAIERFVSL